MKRLPEGSKSFGIEGINLHYFENIYIRKVHFFVKKSKGKAEECRKQN